MKLLTQKHITGNTAVKIASSVEEAIREGRLGPGESLPPVRAAAQTLQVAPATVAAAYRTLQGRGLIVSAGRRGTRISQRSLMRSLVPPPLPAGVRNLRDGNPDARLLPSMKAALREIDPSPRLYSSARNDEKLVSIAAADFARDGVPRSTVTVLNGAMDAIERVLRAHLRPGDRVALEDPGFGTLVDLVVSLGLIAVPVLVDDEGIRPDELQRAIERQRAAAVVFMPRSQNPTGAAITESRAAALRRILERFPQTLVIADDHTNYICDVPLCNVISPKLQRWALVRSLSKALNPDLRIALLTGDARTMTLIEDGLVVGERWVSHITQRIAARLLGDRSVRRHLHKAAQTYRARRTALREELGGVGIEAHGDSGFNVWIPVAEEMPVVQGLMSHGWGVRAGERFRTNAPPAIRITVATLEPEESKRLVQDLASVLQRGTRTGSV